MRKPQFAALTVALMFVTGCHAMSPTGAPVRVAVRSSAQTIQLAAPAGFQGSGTLTLGVALGQSRGYRVEATTADVDQLVVTLQSNGKTIDSTTLSRQQISGSGVAVNFNSLAAGAYALVIDAQDASGKPIGHSSTPVSIASGAVTKLSATLQLDNTIVTQTTGSLDATVTIQDGASITPTPTPTPSETPIPDPTGDKLYDADGKVRVADTAYAVPAGAIFVAPNGSDRNNGSAGAPFLTLQHAIDAARAGDTIVMRGGIYREVAKLAGKRLTIQAYPHEQVWLKGSQVVTGWTQKGNTWVHAGWTVNLMRNHIDKVDINPAYPLADYADMAFYDGRALTQVANAGEVGPGKFCVDQTTNQLIVGNNPNGHTLESSVFTNGLVVSNAAGSVIRGLGFMHYAAHHDQYGAVRIDSDGVTFENNTVAWSANSGLVVFASNCVVRDNTLVFSGMVGLQANAANNLTLDHNAFAYNNCEHFASWESGGAKLCNATKMLIENNLSEQNYANGIWLDVSDHGNTIVRNLCRNNTGHGIFHEISFDGLIAGNVLVNNGHAGIAVSTSGGRMQVYNNTLINNPLYVFDDKRVGEAAKNLPGLKVGVTDAVLRNNLIVGANQYGLCRAMLGAHDDSNGGRSPEKMGVSADGDGFLTAGASQLALWGGSNFKSLTTFQGAGQEKHGFTFASESALFVNAGAGDFDPTSDSPARGKGVDLPADVASALGIAANNPILGAPSQSWR
ncbi:MAG TPA: right-handed parallel beta-helix repeat-containing protein [Oscillatoriaceae cyanobacterium]